MKRLLTSSFVLFASAALFVAGEISQSRGTDRIAAPTSFSLVEVDKLASGPTIPPGPWDEDDEEGTKVASGPTIPPGPWDEDEDEEGPKVASGPTIPPGPWDEDEDEEGPKLAAAGANLSLHRYQG